MVVTELVFHPEMYALKSDAPENTTFMFVTELVSQPEMSALKSDAPLNNSHISVTELVSQSFISADPAGPQSAVAQHVTPVASTAKQLFTAV